MARVTSKTAPTSSTIGATSVIAAAASLATAAIGAAAATATTIVADAATVAAKVVVDTATKAVADFPRLQDDIREIRAAQANESQVLTQTITALLDVHTKSEEIRLRSIDATCDRIDLHLTEQGARLVLVENHVTRHQLILFGIAGPIGLLIFGVIVTILVNKFGPIMSAWLQ